MRVTLEEIPPVEVLNSGVLIRIRDEDGKNVGRLWVGQAHFRWARANVAEKNAKKYPVRDFVEFLDGLT